MSYTPISFMNDFTNLRYSETILDFVSSEIIGPYVELIKEKVSVNPFLIRATGPLIGVSMGLIMLVASVANLAEGVFKGLANLLIGAYKFNPHRMYGALKMQAESMKIFALVTLVAANYAVIGSLGLIIDPRWAFDHIINA